MIIDDLIEKSISKLHKISVRFIILKKCKPNDKFCLVVHPLHNYIFQIIKTQ